MHSFCWSFLAITAQFHCRLLQSAVHCTKICWLLHIAPNTAVSRMHVFITSALLCTAQSHTHCLLQQEQLNYFSIAIHCTKPHCRIHFSTALHCTKPRAQCLLQHYYFNRCLKTLHKATHTMFTSALTVISTSQSHVKIVYFSNAMLQKATLPSSLQHYCTGQSHTHTLGTFD